MPKKKSKKRTYLNTLHNDACVGGRTYSEKIRTEVEDLFDKRFTFQRAEEAWKIPTTMSTVKPWNNETLQGMKTELNNVKDKLSGMNITTWHEHTQQTNLAGEVISHVQSSKRPELCTQAWCKFHEVLCRFDLVPWNSDSFNSVHLCEAPGAFITSLNHFLKTGGYQGDWKWLANTLNPYYEGCSLSYMVADDRLIVNTMDNWYFGPSNIGDITDMEVYEGLCVRAEQMGQVNLVTADGSVDCQQNPAEQEAIVSQLHFCELTTALSILCDGGHFVLKMFTMYESQTVCLLYILNCLFKQVNVFKPATSKPGNSEVYVVCKEFSGREDFSSLLPTLKQFFTPAEQCHGSPVFSENDIPTSYTEQHIACCQTFKDYQQNTILRNLELFENMSQQQVHHLRESRLCCAERYVNVCYLKALPHHNRIVCKPRTRGKMWELNKRLVGSFHERRSSKLLSWKQKVLEWEPSEDWTGFSSLENSSHLPLDDSSLQPVVGQKIDRIRNSRFCTMESLQMYNEVLDCCQFLKYQNHGDSPPKLYSVDEIITILQEEQACALYNDCLNLIIVAGANHIYNGELYSKADLLKGVYDKLEALQTGECLCIGLCNLLTRFTVGLVYILFSCFSKMSLRTLGENGDRLLLVYSGFNDCSQAVKSYLKSVYELSHNKDIQQLVPMTELYDARDFLIYITEANERLLQKRINFLMMSEKEYIQQNPGSTS